MSRHSQIRSALLFVATTAGFPIAHAQTEPAPQPAFDVTSIKPAKPGARGFSIRPLPGRLSAENVTLKMLIAEAYHVSDFQISGGPKWIDSDRYNLEAKASGDQSPSNRQMRLMLQKVLEDRFALKIEHATRQMPVYALMVAKDGSKLAKPKDPDRQIMFRVFQRRQIVAENAPLQNLIEALTWLIARPVVDRTGLEGSFDYKLEWTPDEMQTLSSEAPPQADGNLPPLGVALQQQLGLKLVSQKDAVNLLVIENAEKPAPN